MTTYVAMTAEEAMDLRDGIVDRMIDVYGPEVREHIHDLLIAEAELTWLLTRRTNAKHGGKP